MTTLITSSCALIAFAANSVLCRYALGDNSIDPGSFTSLRLISGFIALFLISLLTSSNKNKHVKPSIYPGLMLFVYASCFSYAYISLDTGIGALILFAAVQITMIAKTLFSGTRLHKIEWLGLCTAFSGFVYLLTPNITSPSLIGFVLMCISGIAWGLYSIAGKSSTQPVVDTRYNFLVSLVFCPLLLLQLYAGTHLSQLGVILAISSGALASGLGYAIWYTALAGLSNTQAAAAQLLVPIIAAYGGVLFSAEILSLRLVLALALVLGGIGLVIMGRFYMTKL